MWGDINDFRSIRGSSVSGIQVYGVILGITWLLVFHRGGFVARRVTAIICEKS